MSDQHDQEDLPDIRQGISAEARELYAGVKFGIEVENFLGSTVGKYLIGRAEEERMDALDELKDANADNPTLIRSLQSIIKRAESIQYWMAEAIQDGLNAAEKLQELDD